MKVLVTGSSGFIGKHLVRRLLDQGHEVIGVDIQPITLREVHPNFSLNLWDIRNHHAMARIFLANKPTHVVHLAAVSNVMETQKDPQHTLDVNVMGFQNVIDRALAAGVSDFVYASSAAVYGDRVSPVQEHDTPRPISLYGATKAANELVAHTYSATHNLRTVGLRFFNVYGPGSRTDNMFFHFAEAVRKNEPIKLYNEGASVRSFVYVEDVVTAIMAALERPASGVYNIAPDEPTSVRAAAGMYLIDCGRINHTMELLPARSGEILYSHGLVDKAYFELGWKAETKLEDGIAAFHSWYKENYR